ncbi:MAG: LOG family protein [Gemmatimonadota bacterium]|nr:LOG family protein [Gemmatimonadota bacterium]
MDYEGVKKRVSPAGARWVCVFGTSDPADKRSVDEAYGLGSALARAGHVVVTGGYGAAMEGASRGTIEAGGTAVGVTCSVFSRAPNPYLTEIIQTHSLLERLETLLRLGDAYVAAKGGTGTLAEIALAWEYINKKIVPRRPLVLLGTFWEKLPGIISDEKAAPGVSLGRAANSIRTAAEVEQAVKIISDSFNKKTV